MIGVVSFTVFGPDPDGIYYQGAVRNAEMYNHFYPELECRFYLGKTPLQNGLDRFLKEHRNVVIVPMDDEEDQRATFWRFLALHDNYDYYLFRDVDSRPVLREREAVAEWRESEFKFHVMRDHPRHGVPILAGLWGTTLAGAISIRDRTPKALKYDYYQVDQMWLSTNIWRTARRSLMIHSSVDFPALGWVSRPFKTPWFVEGFCGEGLYGDDTPRFPEHRLEMLVDVSRTLEA